MNGIRLTLSGVGLVATAALFTTGAVGQGGDTIGTAAVIGALPYSNTGTTVGYVDDYDEQCPYTGSLSNDVVYSYTPAVDEIVDITLCAFSAYDTKLYVYENAHTPGAPFACNDDACTSGAGQPYVSELLGLNLVGGNTYYIVVDGYGSNNGDYTIDMDGGPPPTGACCVNEICVATNTLAECDLLGGTWYEGEDCATFVCPVWNCPTSITTLFASNNGGSLGGAVYFDVTVGTNPLTITAFETNVAELVTFNFDVYLTDPGVSYLGNETTPAAWTLVATGTGVGMGDDNPSPVSLVAPFDLAANTLYGMALVLGSNAGHEYTNGPLGPYSNADIQLDLGSATNVPFTGSVFNPRVWNGTICYEGGGPPPTGACCVGVDCVATNTVEECDLLGGTWYEGEDCATFMCPTPPECPFFHCSARVIPAAGGRENTVYLFDMDGIYTGWSYPEAGTAYEDSWGYRDGCTDRDGHVFFGWGGGLNQHDNDGGNPVQLFPDGGPNGTWRALAFDTTGDGGNGSIWSASFSSDLVEAALDGTILNTYPDDGWSLYGLAYDDVDGNLWGHTTGGEVIKIDATTGTIMPGEGWANGFPNLSAQGGLSGLHDGTGELAAISQGTPDELGVYDLTGTLVGGPWDIEAQSGSNGHLGVAVCLGEAGLVAYFDIKPGSCPNPFNTKAQGKFPTALLGTADFDVMLVNPMSLTLARADGVGGSVMPVKFSYEDVATPFTGDLCDCHAEEGDGYLDMTIKFSRPEMTEVLELEGLTGDLELVLSGELLDGTPFSGADCIMFVPMNEEAPGPDGNDGR